MAPFSVGQSSISQSSESEPILTRVVTGGAECDEDETLVNKHLADVAMDDSHPDGSSRNAGSMGEGSDVDMEVDIGNEHDDNQDDSKEGEQSGLADVDMGASTGSEHDDSQDIGEEGARSGSMDVDMGASAGNERDDNRRDGRTPESSPGKKLPPTPDCKGIRSSEKRKNPTRAAKTKKMQKPPPPPPRPKPKPRIKPKSGAEFIDLVERNYFEEIEFGDISRIVDMIDVTQDIVSHSSPYNHMMICLIPSIGES